MTHLGNFADVRRDYGEYTLNGESVPTDPFIQFQLWFEDVLKSEAQDPTAMVLSSVDAEGHPDSRVVLLKGLEAGQLIFYTNYQSAKAKQIQNNPYVALNFYWPQLVRQVRIRGTIKKISESQSDSYFLSRPLKSQASAIISNQSYEIPNRAFLEHSLNEVIEKHKVNVIKRPDYWGGYGVFPTEFEFWQGRNNRLHDRVHYYLKDGQWLHRLLAP